MTATAYVKLTKPATVGGIAYRPGELIEASRETCAELFRLHAAVPHAGPGRRSLTSDPVQADDVRPSVHRA